MSPIARRRLLYVDPELQLPIVAMLMLLVTGEGLFVGFGFYKAIAISREWQRPHQAFDFFSILLLVVAATCALNLAAGLVLSHRIAGPAMKLRRAMDELAEGRFGVRVALRRSDLLQPLAASFNLMAARLASRYPGKRGSSVKLLRNSRTRLSSRAMLRA